MQTLPQALADHLHEPVTTLATCWRIQRVDGVVLGFTQHDRPLTLGGITYRPAPSFSLSTIERTARETVDNLDISGVFSSAALTRNDLSLGRYDNARLDIFRLNWASPDDGIQPLASGVIGRVTRGRSGFVAEMRGLKHKLQTPASESYSASCRAWLGDGRCRVHLPAFEHRVTVTGQISSTTLQLSESYPDGYLDFGILRWLDGVRTGFDEPILTQQGDQITFALPFSASVTTPIRVRVTAGCDKRLETCRDKFANAINYRGEPHIPGVDNLLAYPGLG